MSQPILVAAVALTILICTILQVAGTAYGVLWLLGRWFDCLLKDRFPRGSWQDDTDEL